MPNGRIDDQYCLAKIRSVLDFDLNRLSFSDSDLQYLIAPLKSPKVGEHLKEKYLNFYRVSMQIYDLKSRTSAKSKRSMPVSSPSARRNHKGNPTRSPKTHRSNLTHGSMTAGRPIGQRPKDCLAERTGRLPEFSERRNSTENCSVSPSELILSPVFDIDKIHNYRDNQSLISSSSDNLSDLSSFDSSQFSLNKLPGSRTFRTNASNLSIYRHLTRSDPELYSTNLLSCGDTDGDTRGKQLFYLKTIYLTFRSFNLLEKFRLFKRRTASFLASIKPEVRLLSDKEDKKDFADKLMTLGHPKPTGENEEKQPSDRMTRADNPGEQVDGRNDQQTSEIESRRRDNPGKPDDSVRINLDKVVSCVDLKRKLFKEKEEGEKRTALKRDELNHFLNSDKFDTKTILGKIESLSNFDPNFNRPKASDQQMKPVRASSELLSSFFRLDLLDNFVTRTISNKLPAFSLKPKLPTQSSAEKCSCKKSDRHEMDVIDLNDANNYRYYKDSIFDSFDLDVEDEQAIGLEFDRKFEAFLQEDLRKLNDEFRLQSPIGSSARESEASQLSSPKHSSCDTTKDSAKSEQFDSIKRLSSFQSRIPVLQRDKSKFSKAMLDKLKIKYDPLNIRKRPKALIQALNEDYESSLRSGRSKGRLGYRRNFDQRGARNVGSIDKLNNRNRHGESKKVTPRKNSIKSLKAIRPPAQSVESMKRLDFMSLKPPKEDVRPHSSATSGRPSRLPKFMFERSTDEQLLLNRKSKPTEVTPDGQKVDKFYHLIKETTGLFRGLGSAAKSEQRVGDDRTSDGRPVDEPGQQQDYQRLKRCVPRTKSESFLNEQLDSHRLNENYRTRLLELELKTNGNCLFQLYDYFDDFKDRRKERK